MILPRNLSTDAKRLLRTTIARQGGLWPGGVLRSNMETEWNTVQGSPKPGAVLLVGVQSSRSGDVGVLLECDVNERHAQGPSHPEWRDAAMGALHRAHTAALKHTLGASCQPPDRKDETWVLRLSADVSDAPIDGESYGLPLFLAIVSSWLGRPLPAELCATGRIDGSKVAEVHGLQAKLDIIAELAPGVRTLLVPPGGRAQLRTTYPMINVREVSTLQECLALAQLTPPDIDASDAGAMNSWFEATRPADLDDVLTRSAIRGAFPDAGFQPYVHAAKWRLDNSIASSSPQGIPTKSRSRSSTTADYVGRLSAHVILRHCGRTPSNTLDVDTIAELPYALRTIAVAHVIQSARDLGNPSITDAAAVADRLLQDTHVDEFAALAAEHDVPSVSNRHAAFLFRSALDLDRQQMMVAGAYARLIAADRSRIAFAAWLNWALCRAWLENLEPNQTSMPAGELFRLAALPADVEGSDVARVLRDDLFEKLGGTPRALANAWHIQHVFPVAAVFSDQRSDEYSRAFATLVACESLGPFHRLVRLGARYRANQAGVGVRPSELALSHPEYAEALKKKGGESFESATSMLLLEDAILNTATHTPEAIVAALATIRQTDFATVHYAEEYYPGKPVEQAQYVVTFSPY